MPIWFSGRTSDCLSEGTGSIPVIGVNDWVAQQVERAAVNRVVGRSNRPLVA